MNHFSEYELDSIHLLEGIKQSWKVPFNLPRIKNKYKIRPDNSTIKGVYETVKIQIPKWLDDRIEVDKNIPQDAHENIYYEFGRILSMFLNKIFQCCQTQKNF
jgi:hypothetical protein